MQTQASVPEGNESLRTGDAPDLTILDLLMVIVRRKWVVLGTLFAFLLLGVLVSLFMEPRYVATEVLQIEKEGTAPLGINGGMVENGQMPSSDSLDFAVTLQTQAGILQSDTLALKVIQDLNLEKTKNYQPIFNPLGFLLAPLSPKGAADPVHAPLSAAPRRQAKALLVFSDHLKVKATDGTRLITVSYTDPDPKLANAVVNDLVSSYIDYNFQIKASATTKASTFLGSQLSDLRKGAEDSQAKLSKLQQGSEVFTNGDSDMAGHAMTVSVVLSRLQDLSTSLSAAESNRVLKEAVYRAVQSGGADSISGLAGNVVSGASPDVVNSLSVLQGLRNQLDAAKVEYAQDGKKFGAEYPRMQQLKSQIEDLTASIEEEQKRIVSRAKSDYEIAAQTEESTRALYNSQKAQADATNNRAIDYQVAKQESEQSRSLYSDLYRKLKEGGALEGLPSTDIAIVDPSRVPGKPKYPNPLLFMAVSFAAGLFFGWLAALAVDRMDGTLQNLEQMDYLVHTRPLGMLAPMEGAAGDESAALTVPLEQPQSVYTESLRTLRTSIIYPAYGAVPKVVLVTGCQPGDGASSVSSNLAILLVQQGFNVLLAEANFRTPTLSSALGLKSGNSLSDMLLNSAPAQAVSSLPQLPGLAVVAAGTPPSNPTELLGSEKMASLVAGWRGSYDFVVLDASSATEGTDPVLLSRMADLVLLVCRYHRTERKAILQSYDSLQALNHGRRVCMVVTDVPDKVRFGARTLQNVAAAEGSYANA